MTAGSARSLIGSAAKVGVDRHAWWFGTAVLYSVIMAETSARYLADTVDYASSIESAVAGDSRALWEFGHLLWRPLGYLTYEIAGPLVQAATATGTQGRVIGLLMAWNWLAGLVGALALNRFLTRLGAAPWSVAVVTLSYVVSFGVLNFAHSGSSYIPGLACLLIALALVVRRETMPAAVAIGAGSALALAVGFWVPYVLVAPAVVAFPLVWFGFERRRLVGVALVAATFGVVLGSAYLLALGQLGITDLAGLRSWISESTHDIVNIKGVSRVVFGLPRSFISMGKDGILFKRYLLKDPYNVVTLADLARLSLVKLGFFYAVLLATVVALLRGKAERRLLVLALLAGIPVLAFAVSWQGGDVERYMPVYPLVFAAWAVVPGGGRPVRFLSGLVLLLVAGMSVVNLPVLSRATAERNRLELERRTEEIVRKTSPGDRVFVVTLQDSLAQASRGIDAARLGHLEVDLLITLGDGSAPKWRETFAKAVHRVWSQGGSVWISTRVFSSRPQADWDWVEGDAEKVSWSDLHSFFAPFEYGPTAGGQDGFALLAHGPRNEQLLAQ